MEVGKKGDIKYLFVQKGFLVDSELQNRFCLTEFQSRRGKVLLSRYPSRFP